MNTPELEAALKVAADVESCGMPLRESMNAIKPHKQSTETAARASLRIVTAEVRRLQSALNRVIAQNQQDREELSRRRD